MRVFILLGDWISKLAGVAGAGDAGGLRLEFSILLHDEVVRHEEEKEREHQEDAEGEEETEECLVEQAHTRPV